MVDKEEEVAKLASNNTVYFLFFINPMNISHKQSKLYGFLQKRDEPDNLRLNRTIEPQV